MEAKPSENAPRRLRIYSGRDQAGTILGTFLIRDGARLALYEESAQETAPALEIPSAALPAVFRRYGKPLDEGVDAARLRVRDDEDDEPLEVPIAGEAATLSRFRFIPFGWIQPHDYLLWERKGEEALAAPAPLIASALTALARAAFRS